MTNARPSVSGARRPLVAAFLSGVFPGVGQLYNREPWKGALFGIGGALTGFGPLSPLTVDIDLADPVPGMRKVLLASVPFLAVALWSVVDAYRIARRCSPAPTGAGRQE